MKKGTLIMTALVVMAMLFASCSSHLSDAEGGSSSKTVSVSLGVDVENGVQKTISTDTDLSGLTYWYKANHNWQQDRPVHGDTGDNFVLIPNYSAGDAPKNLGYFTAGEWTFYVEVRKGSDVIYSGNVDYTIYTSHASPVITVTPDGTGKGTIDITVKIPATGGEEPEKESLAVSCSAGEVEMERTGYANGLATYTGSKNDLAPGAYTFTFRYTDEGGEITEGAAQAVTIFAGQTSTITGTIDGGKWHSSQITINAPGITGYTLKAAGDATSVAPSTNLVYTASAASAQGNTIKYQWFVNGVSQGNPSATATTYTFNKTEYGMYEISCSAIDETAKVIASEDGENPHVYASLYVEVGYKVSIGSVTGSGTVEYGANSSATTIFAAGKDDDDNSIGDIVLLAVTPETGNHLKTLTVPGVDAGDIEYDAASNTASFRMPAQDITVTAEFEAD